CGGSDDAAQTTPTLSETPTVVSGSVLPTFAGDTNDLAVGSAAPVVSGTDLFTGVAVSTADSAAAGRPLMVMFYAHWCPHCQNEVDQVTAWLEDNSLPAGVDYVAVSTFEDATRGNHPPKAWLEREGWSLPAITDTAGSSAAEAYGVAQVPFVVTIDAAGVVRYRYGGTIGPSAMVDLANQLLA
ncbi:MAG TPA: hypothetical protein DEP69_03395, partial [Acidimicrobiaceae bacterium]|nr:hypothetical protein [Acidimicrobiaceae bacterium]